jgi:mannose-1-phosphate guanylyltransferase
MIMAAGIGHERADAWAIVLAGGGGSRLRGCTVDTSGRHVPKQYCVVDGARTLIQLAISRAERVVDRNRVVVVVSGQHREWWEPQLAGMVQPGNVVAQPLSRGTAVGALLPLLQVLARDAGAHLVLFPADHYFRDEARLAMSIRTGLQLTYDDPSELALIGIEPEAPIPDFGYIIPVSSGGAGARRVASFTEKPPSDRAKEMIERGALWNTLILAASGRHLLRVIRDRFPHTVAALRVATSRVEDADCLERALEAIYPSLTTADLSRDVLEAGHVPMMVVPTRAVGWAELGTPERVVRFWDELRPANLGLATNDPVTKRARRFSLAGLDSSAGPGRVELRPPA